MGNKSNAKGLRIGVNKSASSFWYRNKSEYADTVLADIKMREYINSKLANAGVIDVIIKRGSSKVTVEVYVARPGVVIGKGGEAIQKFVADLNKFMGVQNIDVKPLQVKNPESYASFVGMEVGRQVAARIAPKTAALKMIEAAKKTSEIKGISIWIAGRIKGAEIARTEKFDWGKIPRHTLRANLDYSQTEVNVTNAGRHGIKVWIYRNEK